MSDDALLGPLNTLQTELYVVNLLEEFTTN
jgi:hypothetical protein